MQFPVPQFTDVEDKIIGSLTIKQFGIIFGGGVLVFLSYSLTKSLVVLIAFAILFGLPTLFLAFGQINGRKIYNTLPMLARTFTSDKYLVFHREAQTTKGNAKVAEAEVKSVQTVSTEKPEGQLVKLNQALEQETRQEEELIGKI